MEHSSSTLGYGFLWEKFCSSFVLQMVDTNEERMKRSKLGEIEEEQNRRGAGQGGERETRD